MGNRRSGWKPFSEHNALDCDSFVLLVAIYGITLLFRLSRRSKAVRIVLIGKNRAEINFFDRRERIMGRSDLEDPL